MTNPDERLADIVFRLEAVGVACLVMGGHAVRHYGLVRYTNDFDLTLAPDGWSDLPGRLAASGLFPGGVPPEGNSWRPGAFRRFQVGTLPDGREEWLEFWRENHLLDPFADLAGRREVGPYGGREVPFLSLPDLIRSKETERSKDWDDIAVLEEFLDARHHVAWRAGQLGLDSALCRLRSRRGFDSFHAGGAFDDRAAVEVALGRAENPVTQALLLPLAPRAVLPTQLVPFEAVVEQKLRTVAAASPLHRSLVELVRRQYKAACQARDRADKERIRATGQ